MFSFDDESIHLNEYLFNKQKNPGDKFFITGRQVFSFLSFGLV